MEADPPESAPTGQDDQHWEVVRGTCSVCSYKIVSSDARHTIDEKNRDEVNNYFSTNIENGTICSTCYKEFIQSQGKEDELHAMSFPFCYGVNAGRSPFEEHAAPEGESKVNADVNVINELEETESDDTSSDAADARDLYIDTLSGIEDQLRHNNNRAKNENPTQPQARQEVLSSGHISPQHAVVASSSSPSSSSPSPSSSSPPRQQPFSSAPAASPSSSHSLPPLTKIKKKTRPERSNREKERQSALSLSASSTTADLSYLSTLKVSELQEQLKKYNASTKGSKAQLIQRLVRYICLFNTDRPLPTDMSYLNILRAPHINLATYSAADLEMVTAVAAVAAAEQDAAKAEMALGMFDSPFPRGDNP